MNEKDALDHEKRLEQYRTLKTVRGRLESALDRLTAPWPDGPSGQNPFTGNARESRDVLSITIDFSATRGGSPAVYTKITDLNISAYDLGQAIETLIRKKLHLINAEIEKL